MLGFKQTVQAYREKLTADYLRRFGGYISTIQQAEIDAQVQEFANDKAERNRRLKQGDFNPLTEDPGCKSCGKKNT